MTGFDLHLQRRKVLFHLFCFEFLTFEVFISTLPPGVGLMKSNHLTKRDFWKIVGRVKQVSLQQWKEICFPMDLRPTSTVAISAYPRDLATLSRSSSCTFPRPSAVAELPPTTWRSHTICGSYTTRLLTDGFLSMLLISLRLIRSKRTPLLHQTSLRETKKSD